jgi:hypothetical protein
MNKTFIMKYILISILIFLLFSACRVRKVERTSITKDSVATASKDSVHVSSNTSSADSLNITSYDKQTTIYFDKGQNPSVVIGDSIHEYNKLNYYEPKPQHYTLRGVDSIVVKEKYHSQTQTNKQQQQTDSAAVQQLQSVSVHDEVKTKTVDAKPGFSSMIIGIIIILVVSAGGYAFMKFKKFV